MSAMQRVRLTQAFLIAAALGGTAMTWLSFYDLPRVGSGLALAATLAVVWRWRGVYSRERVVLWLEERMPDMRYALVALTHEPDSRFKHALEARARQSSPRRALLRAAVRMVGVPLVLLAIMQLAVRPVLARAGVSDEAGIARGSRSGAPTPAGAFQGVVTPPAYAGLRTETVDNPVSIAALVGSDIAFNGALTGHAVMPRTPTVLRLTSGREPRTENRFIALEPRQDSVPRVVMTLPARDTVLPRAGGVVTLKADARDDIGIISAWFEMIISSGDGESFKFRSGVLARTAVGNAREVSLEASIGLDTMGLKPGDIVHLRAVARDANPAPDAEAGSSETRTLRVFKRSESDSVEIEVMPPPEVGKSELSQRMLIMMTEALVADTKKLSKSAFTGESRNIATEQARLRKRVGAIIFTRLTGEEDAGDAQGALADTVSPMEALLRAADSATGADASTLEPEEGDSPVIAINRPLLEAFNAMWDAERRLGIGEPRQALPFMRAALAAIQRARAAERLYLRGRPPKVVLDIARIRLSGKRDGIDPGARSPRASALTAALARQARFSAALQLLARDSSSAAIDSLTLLRVDALADAPSVAAALSLVVDDLRNGRDATTSLRAARRALTRAPVAGATSRWSGQ